MSSLTVRRLQPSHSALGNPVSYASAYLGRSRCRLMLGEVAGRTDAATAAKLFAAGGEEALARQALALIEELPPASMA
ncbi:hypothetical protein [Gloeobacter morelensis]|uniref:Uncharacterized protein n=1 Tax=Gloeobacter morelensis MG652769 TaxID=2781736 RepID=A0ABY3PPC9_9CYAN|nr:hypothetical protein [Gloeobacter morelensis]UFP95496.1 hypothetical protein ISF26_04405 [Gloeobacter morelensis MG652769]